MANRLKSKTEKVEKTPPVIKNPEVVLKKEKEENIDIKELAKDERTHKIMGSILLFVAFFLAVSFISYFFTWKDDQDQVFQLSNIWNTQNVQVKNLLGVLGAVVSHFFIFKGFGIASLLISTFFFAYGTNLLYKKKIFSISRNLKYVTFGTIILSFACSYIFANSVFPFGGAVGNAMNSWLIDWIGRVGAGVVLFVITGAYLIWQFNPSFNDISHKLKQNVSSLTEQIIVDDKEENVVENENDVVENDKQAHEIILNADDDESENECENNDDDRRGNIVKQNDNTPFTINLPLNDGNDEIHNFKIYEKPSPTEIINDRAMQNREKLKEQFEKLKVKKEQKVEDVVLELNNAVATEPLIDTEESELENIATENVEHIENDVEINNDVEKNELQILNEQEIENTVATDDEIVEEKPLPVWQPITKPLQFEKIEPANFVLKPPPADEIELEITNAVDEPIASEAETIEEDNSEEEYANLPPYDPTLDLGSYKFPSLNLLEAYSGEKIVQDNTELERNKDQIINTLKNYDISITRISATIGPTVTLYEIVPAPGIRISKIKNLEDDIALSLSALGIRIIAPIPGKGTIGIEVPNAKKSIVSIRSLINSDKFRNSNYALPIAIGKTISNEHFIVDLARMPHLLIAGATGQGKSVGVNSLIVSLLYKKHPSQLKFVLVDPKKVELSLYRLIEKHFLAKLPGESEAIITDTKKVVYTLNALCIEMDNRYDLLKEAHTRTIKEYNEKFVQRKLNPKKGHQYMPFIVLVIDEFADLIMTAGKEIETPIARLAQLARAVGIHLVIATQRPSVNIITGTIKANFPSRIAFKVSSKIDSRTILDTSGADQLIGQGDMLISYHGELTRVQCAFVDTPEVDKIVDFIGSQRGYPEAFLLPEYVDENEMKAGDMNISERDSLFEEAAKTVVVNQIGSTSYLQRRMKLGYNRAGRIMDQLEMAGIVGPAQGSKPRDVLIKTEQDLLSVI